MFAYEITIRKASIPVLGRYKGAIIRGAPPEYPSGKLPLCFRGFAGHDDGTLRQFYVGVFRMEVPKVAAPPGTPSVQWSELVSHAVDGDEESSV